MRVKKVQNEPFSKYSYSIELKAEKKKGSWQDKKS